MDHMDCELTLSEFIVNIFCPTGTVIHIYAAYYGIQRATQQCDGVNTTEPTACYYKAAFDQINTTCEYRNFCQLDTVAASLATFDACPNYENKQLFVQYQCLEVVSKTILC